MVFCLRRPRRPTEWKTKSTRTIRYERPPKKLGTKNPVTASADLIGRRRGKKAPTPTLLTRRRRRRRRIDAPLHPPWPPAHQPHLASSIPTAASQSIADSVDFTEFGPYRVWVRLATGSASDFVWSRPDLIDFHGFSGLDLVWMGFIEFEWVLLGFNGF